MKPRLRDLGMCLRLLAAGGVLVLFTLSAQATIVGPDVVRRSWYDGAWNINFVQPAYAVPEAGVISTWKVWAEPGSVKLQVYRPVSGADGPGFQLVGETPVVISVEGLNVIALSGSSQIPVVPGDVLGFRYDGTYRDDPSIGYISYSSDGPIIDHTVFTVWPGTGPGVSIGGVLPLDGMVENHGHRKYSIAADVTAAPIPIPAALWLGLAPLAGLISWRVRRRD